MGERYDLVVIGGGPAGLAAAYAAWEHGVKSILIVERDREPGGILNQCIHNGFGLHYFKAELTGPEYAARFVALVKGTGIEFSPDPMVLELTPGREVHISNKTEGYRVIRAGAVILAMGCRERTRGAIAIPGDRPAGIFTAGTAQRYVNMEGYMVGKRVLILGSGDIGLIMARRMTLEGAKVLACVELMPYSGGLTRNIVQCLQDYGIPLYLSHTVVDIQGKSRLEKVIAARVDENLKPVAGTEISFECDTLLLSVGLIPENELTRKAGVTIDRRTGGAVVYENMETSVPGIFACGNVVHVHDLVDFVTEESIRAGKAAARYLTGGDKGDNEAIEIETGAGVSYTVPQKVRPGNVSGGTDVFFRVNQVFAKSVIAVISDGETVARFKRERLAPGEMERIKIPAKVLAQAGRSVTLGVQ
ncbi:MAG: NAD(P)/FAD-dependent oxidoreductase [Clostridiales bacterium]|jgi:NADPH-dependent 2,4-dienoyl-CoA reductase/sulfur reductase-like enzyme|nr:NAD(P)/FAD-dependent oxidoreductase [Clostridiales bacterium]